MSCYDDAHQLTAADTCRNWISSNEWFRFVCGTTVEVFSVQIAPVGSQDPGWDATSGHSTFAQLGCSCLRYIMHKHTADPGVLESMGHAAHPGVLESMEAELLLRQLLFDCWVFNQWWENEAIEASIKYKWDFFHLSLSPPLSLSLPLSHYLSLSPLFSHVILHIKYLCGNN